MQAMRFRWVPFQLLLGLGLGCENPQPALLAIQPGQANSDLDVRLLLLGRDFVPAMILDPQSGRRVATSDGFTARLGAGGEWAELVALDWLSTGALAGSLPEASAGRLPAGLLDLEVRDPRGHVATLPRAFLELGPDLTPPSLSFTSPTPDTPFAPGMFLQGSIHAADGPPDALADLGWTAYENGLQRASAHCLVAPGCVATDCGFQFTISQTLGEGDVVRVVADASDTAANRNRATASITFTLLEKPTLGSIMPENGGTPGGTDVLVHGSGFLPGSQVVLDGELLFPGGGILVDLYTISGHTPAHVPGSAVVTVQTPLGDATGTRVFTYYAPPTIAAISPASGPAAGGTAVTITGSGFDESTHIYFGASLDGAVPLADPYLQSDTSIVGRVPAGSGVTTVWAFASALGFTKLTGGFTWRAP